MKKTQIPKREYNALLLLYPKGFVEVAASDAEALGVRDRAPVSVVVGRRLDEGRRCASPRTSGPGTVYVPYFIEDMVARLPATPREPRSTRTRTRRSPCGSRRCDHVHHAQEPVRRPSPPPWPKTTSSTAPSSARTVGRGRVRAGRRSGLDPAGRRDPLQPAEVRRLPPGRADPVLPLRPGQPDGRHRPRRPRPAARPWSGCGPAT